MTPEFTMYTTPWCGYCITLKRQLKKAGISYDEVNISEVPDAADKVAQINNGNQTVPTIVFPDGTSLTNPSLNKIREHLAA